MGQSADTVFVLAAVTLALASLQLGFRRHKSYLPAGFFVSGLILLGVTHFTLGHDAESPLWARIASASAGAILVVGHLINFRLQKHCCRDLVCAHPAETDDSYATR